MVERCVQTGSLLSQKLVTQAVAVLCLGRTGWDEIWGQARSLSAENELQVTLVLLCGMLQDDLQKCHTMIDCRVAARVKGVTKHAASNLASSV